MWLLRLLLFLLMIGQAGGYDVDRSCDTFSNQTEPLNVTGRTGVIDSSRLHFGSFVSNLDCQWVLEATAPGYAVNLTSVTCDLEESSNCSRISLAAYDGPDRTHVLLRRWCGQETPQVQSSGSFLTLVLQSEERVPSPRFLLLYSESKHHGSISPTVIALVVVVFVVTVIGGCALVARLRRSLREGTRPVFHTMSSGDHPYTPIQDPEQASSASLSQGAVVMGSLDPANDLTLESSEASEGHEGQGQSVDPQELPPLALAETGSQSRSYLPIAGTEAGYKQLV